jgi:hypothetical protein
MSDNKATAKPPASKDEKPKDPIAVLNYAAKVRLHFN